MSQVQRVVQIDQIAVGSNPPKRESHLRRKEISQASYPFKSTTLKKIAPICKLPCIRFLTKH